MLTFRKSSRWVVATLLAGCAMLAHAVPITGTIVMSSGFKFVNASGNPVSLNDSTGIDFAPDGTGGGFIVSGGSGSFLGIPTLPLGSSITDFQFDPLPLSAPINDFWVLPSAGFSFDLTSITDVVKSTSGISLTGKGIIHSTVTGMEGSFSGNWSLAGTSGTSGTPGTPSTEVSSWVLTTSVPEPMTSALIGIGLLGFSLARVVKKQPHPES